MVLAVLFYIFASLGAVIFLFIKWKQTYWQRKGVDYMEPDFFFGNTTAVTRRKDHRCNVLQNYYNYFKSRGKRFGGVYDFLGPVLIVTDLELIKNILQKDFQHFVNHLGYVNEEDDAISGNLFNLKDQKWKDMRAKLTPTFTTGKIRMMFETVVKSAMGLEKLLDQYATVNDPVDIKPQLILFTTDIIVSVAFGIEANCMENPDSEFRNKFKTLFKPSLKVLILHLIAATFPQWLLVKLHFRMSRKESEDFFVKMVTDVVEHREKNNIYRKDFMHLLIQIKNMGETADNNELTAGNGIKSLSIKQMAAQCITFFIAGFETSSSTMTFALMHLAFNMDIQDRLRKEMQTVLKKYDNQITYDALMEMEYLEMVFQETLRINSVAAGISRLCNKAYPIPESDIVIEPDTEVWIPLYGLHKDPEYFPDPDKFDPERFNKDNKNKIPQFAYLPFGDGPRGCIGIRFGKIQAKVGICTIISKYKVTINSKTQLPIQFDTDRMPSVKGGLWLNLEKIEK